MRIFNKVEGFRTKVNFVDECNNVLGYDTDQDCCERAGWFIADEPHETITQEDVEKHTEPEAVLDMPGWIFDCSFFRQSEGGGALDEGGVAIFRIRFMDQQKYLHIFNAHNGYYGHGFKFLSGGENVRHEANL